MLSYSIKESFSFKAFNWLARAGQCASVLRNMSLKNGFWHVLLNPLPNSVQREEIFVEFGVLIGQLLHHVPHSSEKFSALKPRLSDLAHAYCNKPVDIGNFLLLKECI